MSKAQHMREVVSEFPTAEELAEREAEGWTLVALEWRREVEEGAEPATLQGEVPYGLKVGGEARGLEESPVEREALALMLEMITSDETSLAQVAEELNRQGFRTRRGSKWTQVAIFHMLPRLVDAAPQIFSSADWSARRERHLRSA